MSIFEGGCHCGNLTLNYETEIAAEDAVPRACQCSFCRKHSTRALSDPHGRVEFVAFDPETLGRYRFASGIGEYLFCRNCGVYVGAYMEDDGAAFANVMVSALDEHARFTQPPTPIDYGGEDAEGKRQRRRTVWTPATLIVAGGD